MIFKIVFKRKLSEFEFNGEIKLPSIRQSYLLKMLLEKALQEKEIDGKDSNEVREAHE